MRTALGVLRDYYGGGDKAYEAAGEESTGIIGLLGFLHQTTMNSKSGSRRTMNLRRADTEMVRGEVKRGTKISSSTQRVSDGHVRGGNDDGADYREVNSSFSTS